MLKRDEMLVSRYYYYAKIKSEDYENTLDKLEAETFLTKRTIVYIVLEKNFDFFKHLVSSKPSTTVFRNKFPFMVW